jgi:hypothetical protein
MPPIPNDRREESIRPMTAERASEHWHVSVFAGVEQRFVPGPVIHTTAGGWRIDDPDGEVAPDQAVGDPHRSMSDACQEALRLLRSKLGPPLWPCWGAGAPEGALRELGYERGVVRWQWWPPGYSLVGASQVGPDGAPVPAGSAPVSWRRVDSTLRLAIDEVEGFTAFSQPKRAPGAHRRLLGSYAKDVVLRGGSARWPRKPVADAERESPEWFQQLRLLFALLLWLLERVPEVGEVRTLRFVNPTSGPCFLEEDTCSIQEDLLEGLVRHAAGNKLENGALLVNGRLRVPCSCDFLGRIAMFVELPAPSQWIDVQSLQLEVAEQGRAHRVHTELRLALETRS